MSNRCERPTVTDWHLRQEISYQRGCGDHDGQLYLPFEPHMLEEATATVGPEDADLAARVTNFWLLKTIEEQRAGGSATEAAPADEY